MNDEPREPGSPGEHASFQDFLQQLRSNSPPRSRYDRRGEIARGGMGAILEVWDEDLRRTLAMKVIHGGANEAPAVTTLDERTVARFLEEAQIAGQLEHPSIVPIHEIGIDAKGRLYYTMPLIEGMNLKEILERVAAGDREWTVVRTLGVILRVCEAMAFAHSRNVIHRDLKPENIMVGKFGEVYVMDWGLARIREEYGGRLLRTDPDEQGKPRSKSTAAERAVETGRSRSQHGGEGSALHTVHGDVVGTPGYMPPEQARGELERLGPQADVYAMGAILYHLVAGHPPHTDPGSNDSSADVLMKVIREGPTPLDRVAPDTSKDLVAICERAMQRDPSDRYRDLHEMREDLQRYLERGVGKAKEALKSSRLVRVAYVLLGIAWWMLVVAIVFVGVIVAVLPSEGQFHLQLPIDLEVPESAYRIVPRSPAVDDAALTNVKGEMTLLSTGLGFGLGAAAPTVGFLVFLMLLIRPIRKILGTLRDGSPFTRSNVRRMRWVGFLCMLLSVIGSLFYTFSALVVEELVDLEGVTVTFNSHFRMTPLVFGLIMFVLAEVFRLGSELEDQSSRARSL